jgi:radical SAM superfamily enzyme YgiQ (UPF0313 family)
MYKCLLLNVASGTNFVGNGRSAGVYRIAHYLRQHDWNVEVIDFIPEWTLEELKQLAVSRIDDSCKFFGFSHMYSIWSETLELFTGWLKETYPDVKLISGSGVSPQFYSRNLDYYIQGFGEKALAELLKYLFSNGERPRFSLLKANNKPLLQANEQYPSFPMRSLNIIYEDRDYIQPEEWLGIEFARGCKFQCDFCNFPVLGVKGDYTRDADDFEIQMRDAYDRFGVTNYLVADETFNDRTEKITKFADVVEKLNFTPWFTGFIRPDLIVKHKEHSEELLRMNFLGHHYGVESFNHDAVKAVGKGTHPDKIKQGLIDIKNYFETHGSKRYRTLLTFIIGLPGEPAESWSSTIEWLTTNWQGQAFTPFVLEIPLGELNRKSKMSLDYQKYGFRKFADDQKEISYQHARVSNEILVWENDHLNYYQAYEIFDRMMGVRNNPVNKFKLAPWDLAMIGLPGDIDDRLKLPIGYLKDQTVDVNRKKFVEEYKKKKLNL